MVFLILKLHEIINFWQFEFFKSHLVESNRERWQYLVYILNGKDDYTMHNYVELNCKNCSEIFNFFDSNEYGVKNNGKVRVYVRPFPSNTMFHGGTYVTNLKKCNMWLIMLEKMHNLLLLRRWWMILKYFIQNAWL